MAKKQIGIGATCSVANKYLHPAKDISDKYPNATAHSRVENLLVINRKERKVKRRDQDCIVFCHADFEGKELYCVKRWVGKGTY